MAELKVKRPDQKTKKTVDWDEREKLIAGFVKKGLSNKEISEKMGINYQAVWKMAKPYRDKDKKKSKSTTDPASFIGFNSDRHLCKTCKYKSVKGGCDYIGKTGHSRGCSVETCSVYEKK